MDDAVTRDLAFSHPKCGGDLSRRQHEKDRVILDASFPPSSTFCVGSIRRRGCASVFPHGSRIEGSMMAASTEREPAMYENVQTNGRQR